MHHLVAVTRRGDGTRASIGSAGSDPPRYGLRPPRAAQEARREGRGEFWTAEGEELIAGARRTTGKVVAGGEKIGRTAAERTKNLTPRRPAREEGVHAAGRPVGRPVEHDRGEDLRAAS